MLRGGVLKPDCVACSVSVVLISCFLKYVFAFRINLKMTHTARDVPNGIQLDKSIDICCYYYGYANN